MLYYECHITIEPVFDSELAIATGIAKNHGFKIASLLMKKRIEDTPQRSEHDTFMTSHGQNYIELQSRMIELIKTLKNMGFKVWRYKIEEIILDSRFNDIYKLI